MRGGCYRNCDAEVDVTAAGVSNWSAYIHIGDNPFLRST